MFQQKITFLLAGLYVLLLLVVFSLPIITIFGSWSFWNKERIDLWLHLSQTYLLEYIINSIILLLGSGIISAIIGVSFAWLITIYEFSFRNIIKFLVLTPLAIPSYLIAYIYHQQFADTVLFNKFISSDSDLIILAIFFFSLTLYPYVYLFARASFIVNGKGYYEVARVLGTSETKLFCKIAIPLAKPAILGGILVVMMEVIADYGIIAHFGITSITVGILKAWRGFNDLIFVLQLSSLLIIIVVLFLLLKSFLLKNQIFSSKNSQFNNKITRKKANNLQDCLIVIYLIIPILFGFVIPIYFLLNWFLKFITLINWNDYFKISFNSLAISLGTTFIIFLICMLLMLASTINTQYYKVTAIIKKIMLFSYAIPGLIVAIVLWAPFNFFEKLIKNYLNFEISWLSTSLLILVLGYTIRFTSILVNGIKSGQKHIHNSTMDSAKLLSNSKFNILKTIKLPLIKYHLIGPLLLIAIDILKELPMTLFLRPVGFNTLSVYINYFAEESQMEYASIFALTLIGFGLIPILILHFKKI